MKENQTAAAPARLGENIGFFKKLLFQPEFPIVVFIIGLALVINAISQTFFDGNNLMNITKQIAINGIITVAMAIALTSGGIDLSVGASLGLCVSVAGTFIMLGWPLLIVTLISVLVGLICGFLNGVLIIKLNIAPIIVTLGTMNVYRGVAFIYTGGQWESALPKEYLFFGVGAAPLIFWLLIAFVMMIVMHHTSFGRHIYAIGGDENCARLAGINLNRMKVLVYALVGAMVGFAAMLFIGRTSAVQSSAGTGYETQAIASAVIGGISITGGRGRLLGTIFGTILMGLILNAMTLLKISAYWQGAVTGIVIILALLLDSVRNAYMNRRNRHE